ncbi:hypothetical protein RRG08_048855 [Elysia crispata]|uniref:Uncharacterized protein n=1 Tax=Elysia crispata TaxID=231223 RepID=A0AAE1DZL0_9GAST|nr:hypothetical protein RRG08_048855 [Elysia crispata]
MASVEEEKTLQHIDPDVPWPEQKRHDQGLYECEVWLDSLEVDVRADLTGLEGNKEWKTCEKNPGHKKFIPAPDFSSEHLPEEYRSAEILDLVQSVADLTVRIRVRHTSIDRPDGYPFCNFRGLDVPHTGTGVVTTVCHEDDNYVLASDSDDSDDESVLDEEDDDRDEETKRRDFEAFLQESKKPAFSEEDCPCFDCEDARLYRAKLPAEETAVNMYEGAPGSGSNGEGQKVSKEEKDNGLASVQHGCQVNDISDSDKASNPVSTEKPQDKPCWLVFVETALHVVYDTKEARSTVVDAFYNTNSASARTQTLYGFSVKNRFEEEDRCIFECATHNEELVRRLSAARAKRYKLNKTLGRPLLAQRNQTDSDSNTKDSKSGADNSGKEIANSSLQANRLAIIVGHPHGRSKTITVGQWMHRVKSLESRASVLTHYIYDTPTCKGNSGGTVLTLSAAEDERVTIAIFNHRHRSSTTTPEYGIR